MADLDQAKANLTEKIDDLFGFNIQNKTDGISYDFGQYRLNKLYKPLVKYFIDQFMKSMEEYSEQDAKKIIGFFTDFFSLYYNNGDFGYFKNRFSSYEYRIPYSGKDTEFWWATKDCYYVKTSDVTNNMNINIGGLLEQDKTVQIRMFKRTEKTVTDNGDDKYSFDIRIEDIFDKETNDFIGYSITFVNTEETKTSASSSIFTNKITEILRERGIDYKNTPILKNLIENFMKKWGRDYFIHKRLKDFLKEEVEWYFFQMLKNDISGKADILTMQSKIEEIKLKFADEPDVIDFKIGKLREELKAEINGNIYKESYLWIINYINILADLEEFKSKLRNKKRKVIEENYCITLGDIQKFETVIPRLKQIFLEVSNNTEQLNEWKEQIKEFSHLNYGNIEGIIDELKNGKIEKYINFVVDTKHFNEDSETFKATKSRGEKELYDYDSKLNGILIKSENFQGLNYLTDDFEGKIKETYIDPPYNTGNDGFIYKDGYSDSTRCSLMYDRLILNKKLLDTDGTIFSSIDENEQDNLKKLFDLTYNKIDTIKIKVKAQSGDSSKISSPFTDLTEYIDYYSKTDNYFFNELEVTKEYIDSNSNTVDQYSQILESYGEIEKDNVAFSFFIDKGKTKIDVYNVKGYKAVSIPKESRTEDFYIKNINNIVRTAAFSGEFKKQFQNKKSQVYYFEYEVTRGKNKGKKSQIYVVNGEQLIYLKNYSKIILEGKNERLVKLEKLSNLRNDISWTGIANEGGVTLNNGKKPEKLLDRILEIGSKKNDIVIDYFMGSATTQAVAHKKGRKWIGLEINDYFESIDIPRMKRVLSGETSGISLDIDGNQTKFLGGGFLKYIKLNQYEDWFNEGGYLDSLEGEISELTNKSIDGINDIKEILYPLDKLKDKIYHLDDTLDE